MTKNAPEYKCKKYIPYPLLSKNIVKGLMHI